MLIDKLKTRLGDRATAFEDDELTEFIDVAKSEYNLVEGKHDALIVDLALCTCYLRLATDSATFFKYKQASEEVDKTATPKMFMQLYKHLWESVEKKLPSGAETFQIYREDED